MKKKQYFHLSKDNNNELVFLLNEVPDKSHVVIGVNCERKFNQTSDEHSRKY